jgi:hypothetical protein
MTQGDLPEGKPFPIAGAKLSVDGRVSAAKAPGGGIDVRFRASLKAGSRTKLQGWFTGASDQDLCGAYFATVTRL